MSWLSQTFRLNRPVFQSDVTVLCEGEIDDLFSESISRPVWRVSPPGLRIIAVLPVPFCSVLEQPLVLLRFVVEIFRLFSCKLTVLLSVSVSGRFLVPLEKVLFGATSNVSEG